MAKRRQRPLSRVLATLVALVVAAAGYTVLEHFEPAWFPVAVPPAEGELQVYMLDVGNADALVVRQGSYNMLIDAGNNADGDEVVAALKRLEIERLHLVVATHADADHIGGMDAVVQALPVDTFLMAYMPAEATPTTQTYLDLLEALDTQRVAVTEAVAGDSYTLGSAAVTLLGPPAVSDDSNDMSIVCRVDFGAHGFLFMGDASKSVEQTLLDSGAPLRADVIKIGHHGSATSSGYRFLQAVQPTYALISCGANNSYGHPHSDTLSNLEALHIQTCRTDLWGAVLVTSDGQTLTVDKATV